MNNLSKAMDIFSDILTKSRFEQRATEGNFIPRPDPKKNTTSENEEETSILLTKESPIQGPGTGPTHSKPSKEVVGRGKKASQEIISEAATPDKSTYVVGMEKAEEEEEYEELTREQDLKDQEKTIGDLGARIFRNRNVIGGGSRRPERHFNTNTGPGQPDWGKRGSLSANKGSQREADLAAFDRAKYVPMSGRQYKYKGSSNGHGKKEDIGENYFQNSDDAREAAKYQTRKPKLSVMEQRKPATPKEKDPNAPKKGQWKKGKWVQELVNFIKARYEGEDFIPEEGKRLVGMAQRTKDWNEFRRRGGTTYAQFVQEYPQHSSDAILGREPDVQPTIEEGAPIERNWVQDKDTGQDIDLETGEVRGDDDEVLNLDDLPVDSLEGLASEESDDGSRPEENFLGDTLDDENAARAEEALRAATSEAEDRKKDDDSFEVDYGEGPHILDKAEDNIYAIATAAAKGDEDKKEKIVLALKRNHQNLLKAFRFAGEKPKRLRYITSKEADERDRQEIQDFWDVQYRDWQEAQNPTKPRWGGEGIGQHMEKAKWEKLIRIKSGSDNTKGKILPFESAEDAEKKLPEDEQAKLRSDRLVRRSTRYLEDLDKYGPHGEGIHYGREEGKILPLDERTSWQRRRGNLRKAALLKAFGVLLKAAERRTKRQKKADQEAGLNRRLEGVGMKTTPAGGVDAQTTQKYGLIKPADALAVGRSAQAMSSKAGDAFARQFDQLRRDRGDIVGTLEWHKRKREEPDDPEAVVTEADLMLPKERRKRELAYDKSQRRLNRRHDPLYTGAAKRKHIKRRLLNIAEANRDAGREQIPVDSEGNRPGYSSSPWDYLPYPRVRSKLNIIRNREYNQRRDDQKRWEEELPW